MNTPPRSPHRQQQQPRQQKQQQQQQQRQVSPRLPLPSAVQVLNWLPLPHVRGGVGGGNSRWFRPEPSVSLLHKVRLDLVVGGSINGNHNNHNGKDNTGSTNGVVDHHPPVPDAAAGMTECSPLGSSERILYSRVVATGTIQPVWQHLNESIRTATTTTTTTTNGSSNSNDDDRCLTMDEYESMTLRFSLIHDDDDKDDDTTTTSTTTLVHQLLIHPSRLVRLTGPLPVDQLLPLNLMLVHYTDQSVRVTPAHYALLRQPPPQPQDDDYCFQRFDDLAFSTLDQVSPAVKSKGVSLLDQDEGNNQYENNIHADDTTSNDNSAPLPLSVPTVHDDNNNESSRLKKANRQAALQLQQRLQQVIQHHEQALREEWKNLQDDATVVQQLRDRCITLTEQVAQLREAVQEQRQVTAKLQFRRQAQQIRLVSELQAIYPITTTTTTTNGTTSNNNPAGYYIRGLALPHDLLAPNNVNNNLIIPEEEVSAALGYLCHTIHMLSKYLSVQLRYRIVCQSSKSGIQDDRAILYPLFWAGRSVEQREQLLHGWRLLHANVECLCRERGIRGVLPTWHILAKLRCVYQHVLDGYDED